MIIVREKGSGKYIKYIDENDNAIYTSDKELISFKCGNEKLARTILSFTNELWLLDRNMFEFIKE